MNNFAFDLKTFCWIGIVVTGLYGAWGQHKQAKMIEDGKSAEAVSFWLNVMLMFMYIGYVAKGLAVGEKTTYWLSALRVICCVPILRGMAKHSPRTLSRLEQIALGLLSTGVVVMAIRPATIEVLYQIYACITLVSVLDQPRKIIQARSPGKVSLVALVTLSISTSFWTWYSVIKKIPSMYWLSLGFAIVFTSTAIVWIMAWFYEESSKLVQTQKI